MGMPAWINPNSLSYFLAVFKNNPAPASRGDGVSTTALSEGFVEISSSAVFHTAGKCACTTLSPGARARAETKRVHAAVELALACWFTLRFAFRLLTGATGWSWAKAFARFVAVTGGPEGKRNATSTVSCTYR